MIYKSYIQVRLDQYDFFSRFFNLLDDPLNGNIQIDFCTRRGSSFLIINQNKRKYKYMVIHGGQFAELEYL